MATSLGLGLVLGLATWGCGLSLALLVLGLGLATSSPCLDCLGLATSGSSCLGCRLVGGWALLVGVGTLGYRTVWPGLGTAFGVGTALS